VGFQRLGVYRNVGYKLGAWHDVGWWHRRVRAPASPPAPPAPVSRIQTGPDWAAMLTAGLPCLRIQTAAAEET
jgi:hypothetical protein